MRVRIVDVPPGEAPEEVRRAWVGLNLPIADAYPEPVSVPSYGVLTGPKTWLGHLWRLLTGRGPTNWTCYIVFVDEALVELSQSNGAAAEWWRENTPHLLGETFGFPIEVCAVIAERTVGTDPRFESR